VELAEVIGHLALLRRFPVCALAGETPSEALLSAPGMAGDRVFQIVDERTETALSSSEEPDLLRYSVRFLDDMVTGEDPAALARVRTPDGQELPLADPAWVSDLSQRIGRPLRLRPRAPRPEGGLQVLTVPTVRFLESVYGGPLEARRSRANFLIDLPDARAFEEDRWIGKRVRVGETLLEIVGSCHCVVTALEPETPDRDLPLLAAALSVRGGAVGVQARAVSGRRVRVADPVSLAD
jgi:hypothetical protein